MRLFIWTEKPAGLLIKYRSCELGTRAVPGAALAMGDLEDGWAEACPSDIPGELAWATVRGPLSWKSLLERFSEHGWCSRRCRTA